MPALFCIAGLGGNPLPERRLARELGDERPVYGLQHRGVDGQHPPHDDIGAMATEFLADIRQLQPTGPYYLAGFSGGGVVAFEMARRLRAMGERVPLLVLLDAFNPKLPRWRWHQKLSLFLQMCQNHGVGYASRRLLIRFQSKLETSLLTLADAAPNGRFKNRYLLGQAAFVRALGRYEPQAYAGDALLIRSSPRLAAEVDFQADEWNGWRSLIRGELEVAALDCRHDDVLGDHVGQTAAIVRAALASAHAREAR